MVRHQTLFSKLDERILDENIELCDLNNINFNGKLRKYTSSERLGHWEKALLTAITANSHLPSLVSLLLLLFSAVLTVAPILPWGTPLRSFCDSRGSLSSASATSCNNDLPTLLSMVTFDNDSFGAVPYFVRRDE